MKKAIITVRGKTTKIKYKVLDRLGLIYASVIWQSGKGTFFYKGMYGIPDRWEQNSMPDDLILVLSDIFNKETPELEHVSGHPRPEINNPSP